MNEKLLLYIDLDDYDDGSALRNIGIVIKTNLFEDVPTPWTKSKSSYWEKFFVDLLNRTVFKDSPLPDDIMDRFRERRNSPF